MIQGLVQVARSGRAEKTVASICLQVDQRGNKREIRETHKVDEWKEKMERETELG